jgi:subtilisin family serine protease
MIRVNRWNNLITFGISALAIILIISSAGAAQNARTESFNGKEVVAGEVLMKFKVADQKGIDQAVEEEDVDEKENVGSTHVMRFHSRSKNVDKLIKDFSNRDDVLYAEPNYILHTTATPSDTYFGLLWGMKNTGQTILGVTGTSGADISATSAWDMSTGSYSIVTAVIDTGIDYNHPDLAANVWSAPSDFTVTIGGRPITCSSGTHGFNAILNTCDPLDDNDHGTHVSGTIGAVGNNGIGVVGVNWNTKIMGSKFLDASGSGTLANAINAIEFAIQAKTIFGDQANVRVLSNSWGGGGFSMALLDEINSANANNMLFVAAAGNSGSNNDVTSSYPSNYDVPNVVAVAATDNKDNLASFSSYGLTTVDLGAPGVSVASTIRNGNYAYMSGTSMATPHVSGAAALILSRCDLNTAELKANILDNVDHKSSLAGKTVTGGRLNVYKAIVACSTPPAPDFSLSASSSSLSIVQGASKTSMITVGAQYGFSDIVNLDVNEIPNAVVSLSSTSVTNSGTSTLTVNSATAAPGSYTLTVTGTSGAMIHTITIAVTITAPSVFDFSLSASPTSRTVSRGSSTYYNVAITRSGAGSVSFSVSGLPSGATGSFSPTTTTGTSSKLSIKTTRSSTPTGVYLLTIKGTSGSLIKTTNVTLTVTR